MKRTQTILLVLIAAFLCFSGAMANSADTEALTITGGDGIALEILSEYPNLKSLTLEDYPAFDLSALQSCSQLTTLTISWSDGYSGNVAYDLSPLQNCSRLTTLALVGQGINDLSVLSKIPRLTNLHVENIAVSDYSAITKLSLTHLQLLGADAESVTAIFTAIGKKLQSATIGNCTLTNEANDAVLSSTRLLSLNFKNAEGIDGSTAKWSKLSKLTNVTINGGSVNTLDFCDSYVSTVIAKLTDVFIGGTICSVEFDKYFLITSDVPQDEMLNLVQGSGRRWQYATVNQSKGQISADVIAAFSSLTGLLSLDIQSVAPDAFTKVHWDGFPKLEQLKLRDCENISLEILSQLSGLLRLSVQNANVSGLEGISTLSKLQELSLIQCNAADWSFLDALSTRLTLINLAGSNGPQTLGFVKNLEKLKVLALDDTPITNLEPLSGSSLESVYLYGCTIADYTPLETLNSLTLLYCNADAELPALSCRIVYDCVTLAK